MQQWKNVQLKNITILIKIQKKLKNNGGKLLNKQLWILFLKMSDNNLHNIIK